MCKNSENGAKLTISTKYAVEKRHRAIALAARLRAFACAGLCYDFGTGQSRPRALACGAILRNDTGSARVGQQ